MEDDVAGETSHDLAQYTFNLPASPLAQLHKISEQQLEQDGYDSDAGLDPNNAVINEGPLECDEEDIQEVRFDSEAAAGAVAATNGGEFVDIPESQLTKLKVAELKQELAKRGQQVNGNKKVLLERLMNALRNGLPLLSAADANARTTNDLRGFSPGARWKLLLPINEVLPEPQHVVGMRAPTIPEGEEHFIAPKQNFAEVFDHMPFLGKEKVPKYHGNQRPVIVNGEQVWEEQHTTKSGVKSEFITANNLHAESSPQDWFKAFLPIHNGSVKNPHQSNNCWTHRWAMFTNTKALSRGAGVEGGIYSTFQPFSHLEIEQFIGLYILQGLNPSLKVDSKFHSQLDDPIQGNDLCYRVFGSNASKQHKQFKAFFTVQDPIKTPPARKDRPTYKVDPLLKHVQLVSMRAWRLGRDISGDEQTIGFQRRHADKLRITYKAEGESFQCDVICDSGYTWTFYFRTQPAPQKWLQLGYSPLLS